MDTELLKMSGASAGIITIVLVIYRVLKTIQGKRLVSNCCGKTLELGFEIKNTLSTPKDEVSIKINNPIRVQNETSNPPQ